MILCLLFGSDQNQLQQQKQPNPIDLRELKLPKIQPDAKRVTVTISWCITLPRQSISGLLTQCFLILVNRLRFSHHTIWIFQQLLNADFRVKCSLFRGCWRISTVGACAQSTCFYILHSSCHLVVATSRFVAGCTLQLLQLLLQLVGFELGIGIFIFTFVGNNGLLTDRLAAFRWAISSITFRYL